MPELVGIVGEDGDKGRMEELTAGQASGPLGLIRNPYVSLVALSIGFSGFMYGYPSVLRCAHDNVTISCIADCERASSPTSSPMRTLAPTSQTFT